MNGRPAKFRMHHSVDRWHHTEKTKKEFQDLIFESCKNLRVLISGGPARKLRRTDIRLIEWVGGKPPRKTLQ